MTAKKRTYLTKSERIERDLTAGNMSWASLIVRAVRVIPKVVRGKSAKKIAGIVGAGFTAKELLDMAKFAGGGVSKQTIKQSMRVTASGHPQPKYIQDNLDEIVNIIWNATADLRHKYAEEDWKKKYMALYKVAKATGAIE